MQEKHGSVVSHTPPAWSATQAVPWWGIEPATFWFSGQHSIHWATLAKAKAQFSKDKLLQKKWFWVHKTIFVTFLYNSSRTLQNFNVYYLKSPPKYTYNNKNITNAVIWEPSQTIMNRLFQHQDLILSGCSINICWI